MHKFVCSLFFTSALFVLFFSGVVPQCAAQASRRLPPPGLAQAKLQLVSPAPESLVTKDSLDVFFDVKNVVISPQDYRIVVLLGGSLRETISHPLRPASFRDLKPGTYLLRAFIVGPRGAIVRSPDAMVMTFLHVQQEDPDPRSLDMPLLTVASPEGIFSFEDSRLILFDFTTSNIPLGERGLRLRYRIGNFTGYLSQNSPVLLTELPAGEHVLLADIVGENNVPIPGPFLSAQCRFTVLPPPPRAALVSETMENVLPAIPLGYGEEFENVERIRVISPEPGLSVLVNDPAWED